MNVESLMSREPDWCSPEDSIQFAAVTMRDTGVGMLPVVDPADGDRPVGVITDRDICLAVAGRHDPSTPVDQVLQKMPVSAFMSRPPVCCALTATAQEALDTLREHRVRRVVVVDELGAVCGVLALDDLAAEAKERVYEHVPSHSDVVDALRAVSRYQGLQVSASR